MGPGMCSAYGLLGREVDFEAVAPFLMSLEHSISGGIGTLAEDSGLCIADGVVCETIIA